MGWGGVGAPAPEQEPGLQLPHPRSLEAPEKGLVGDLTDLGEDPGRNQGYGSRKRLPRSFSQCPHFTGRKTETPTPRAREKAACKLAVAKPAAPGVPACYLRRGSLKPGTVPFSQLKDGAD